MKEKLRFRISIGVGAFIKNKAKGQYKLIYQIFSCRNNELLYKHTELVDGLSDDLTALSKTLQLSGKYVAENYEFENKNDEENIELWVMLNENETRASVF